MSKFKEVATKASRAAEAQVTLTKLCDNTSLIEGAAEDFVDDDEDEEENASEVVQLGCPGVHQPARSCLPCSCLASFSSLEYWAVLTQ